MAEGDFVFYNNAKEQIALGNIDLASDTIKVALMAGHTPDIDADAVWSDVSADEGSGTGYATGGATLAGKSVTQDNANDRAIWDADDVVWSGLDSITPSHAVFYQSTGTPSTSLLIGYMVLGTAANGSDYTIQFDAGAGIATLS